MSQKYFYKITLQSGYSIGMGSGRYGYCSLCYEVGKTYTAVIPNSKLIGFRTLREARDFRGPKSFDYHHLNKRIFRCLPLAPVIRIHNLTEDYSREGYANFWMEGLWKKNAKHKDIYPTPPGTSGCKEILVLKELEL